MTKPIVSISFGRTVVFLMGGRTREVPPVPVLVRSGDVVIMGGESRFCFHSVPRVVENSCPEYLLSEKDPPAEFEAQWDICRSYIANSRINLNCRQHKSHQEK